MISAQWLTRLFAIALLCTMAACASTPKPTTLKVSVNAQPNVNQAKPIVVRIYALKSLTAFNGADFFSLFDKDKETLGGDMLDREELQLMPGDKRDTQKQFPPETHYIGVIAAFRDLESSQWRASVAMPAGKMAIVQMVQKAPTVQIRLEKNTVSITAQ